MSSANDDRKSSTPGDPGPPDAMVVRRVLEGNRHQYEVLIRRYQERMHRFAYAMVGDHHAATDLVQDAFVRAYTSLESCTEASSFRLWVLQILRDRCRDYLQNLKDIPESPEEKEGLLSPVGGSTAVDGSEVDWTLRDALTYLPGAHREAFLLKHLHGHSYPEIAEMLGASLSAVEMRVRRSREILRSHIERGCDP